jgi:hypothetical protein
MSGVWDRELNTPTGGLCEYMLYRRSRFPLCFEELKLFFISVITSRNSVQMKSVSNFCNIAFSVKKVSELSDKKICTC